MRLKDNTFKWVADNTLHLSSSNNIPHLAILVIPGHAVGVKGTFGSRIVGVPAISSILILTGPEPDLAAFKSGLIPLKPGLWSREDGTAL